MHRRIRIFILFATLTCFASTSLAYWGLTGSSTSDSASIFSWDSNAQEFVFSAPIDLGQYGNYPYDAVKRPSPADEVWIPGASGDGVVVIDNNGTITHEIPTNEYPVSIAFNPLKNIALVSCRDGDNLDIIDTDTYAVVGSLAIPGTSHGPGNIIFDPQGRYFYMVSWYDNVLFKISDDGTTIVNQRDLGDSLWQLVIDPNFAYHLFVTDRGTDQVRMINPVTLDEIQTFNVGDDPWGIDIDYPMIVVACEDSGDVYLINYIDMETQHVPLPAGADPRDVSITTGWAIIGGRELLGAVAYVAGGHTTSGDPMYVIDLYDGTILYELDVPGTNTNVVAVEAQWPMTSSVENLPAAEALNLVVSPNPFNPQTQVKFQLEKSTPVRLCVFDVSGELVRTLLVDTLESGDHVISWNGLDQGGRHAPSGTYLVMIQAGDLLTGQKIALVR